jgi:hypothetical protein
MDSNEKRSGGQSEQRERGRVMHVGEDRSPLTDGKEEDIVAWTAMRSEVEVNLNREREGESCTLEKIDLHSPMAKRKTSLHGQQ